MKFKTIPIVIEATHTDEDKKMTIGELIEILKTIPQDMTWGAYEGEASGIRIDNGKEQWGFIHDGFSPFREKQWYGLEKDG